MSWLSAFLLTQLIEAPIYAWRLKHHPRRWLIALGASSFTHPIVFFLFPVWLPDDYVRMVLLAEAFAVLIEAAWLSVFQVRHSVSWAVCANGLSVLIGMMSRAAFGWP
ncbi:MAG: hypothetical protein VX589_08950 [Myxococcota bacterium]|nr:hypothetical protein [Myxococcota bacterium]